MSDVQVNIPYQREHKRWSVLLRPILMLPIIIVMLTMIIPNHSLYVFDAFSIGQSETQNVALRVEERSSYFSHMDLKGRPPMQTVFGIEVSAAGIGMGVMLFIGYLLLMPLISFSLWGFYIVNIATALTLLFRKKYPDWWFNWNQNLQSFVLRIYCYALFITDRMPSLEEQDSHIKLQLPNPKEENLGRYMPLIKWLLILPYSILYLVLIVGSLLLVPISFIAIMLTGKLPYSIYWYQVSVIKFYLRLVSYSVLLVTDKYPKFVFKD